MPTRTASGPVPKRSATSNSKRPVQRRQKLPVHSTKGVYEIRAASGERHYLNEQGKVIRKCVHAGLRSSKPTEQVPNSRAVGYGKKNLARRQQEMKVRFNPAPSTSAPALRPLTVAEAAAELHRSVDFVRNHFRKLPGVRIIPSVPKRGKRPYNSMEIPVEVFEAAKKSWTVQKRK